MKKQFITVAVAFFLSGQAYAADPKLTVQDAHEFISGLVKKDAIHVHMDHWKYKYWFFNYQSDGCMSSISIPNSRSTKTINWSDISKVTRTYTSVDITGLVNASDYRNQKLIEDTNKYELEYFVDNGTEFTVLDERTALQLEKAMKLLMNSCQKKSKFD